MNGKRSGMKYRVMGGMMLAGLMAVNSAYGATFDVSTPQELQTALSQASANGDDDTINVAAGYYIGSFNFNSSENFNLTVQAASGVANTDVIFDGDGNGTEMNFSASSPVSISVLGMTFKRNCGSLDRAAIKISTLGDVVVRDSRMLGVDGAKGWGLYVSTCRGLTVNDNIFRCSDGATGGGTYANATAAVLYDGNLFEGNSGRKALEHHNGTLIVFRENEVVNNTGDYSGGGSVIHCEGNATLENNVFSENSGVGAYVFYFSGDMVMNGNMISDNDGSSYCLYASGSVTFRENNVVRNSFNRDVIYFNGSSMLENNVITHNTVRSLSYSVVHLRTGGSVINNIISDNTGRGLNSLYGSAIVTGNTIANNRSGGYGAGVYAEGSSYTYTFTSNTITGNKTTGSNRHGGGVYVQGTATFEFNVFSGNTATGYGGGVFDDTKSKNSIYRNNIFENNSAVGGGGAGCIMANEVTFINNRLTGNGTSGYGGGIRFVIDAALTMVNNTVSDNTAGGNGGGIALNCQGSDEQIWVYNNIIWGNRSTGGSGDDIALDGAGARKELYNNNVNGLYGVWDYAVDNMDVAPLFVNALAGDYHLRNGSLLADAGTGSAPQQPLVDLELNVRNTNTVDIGCYEMANTGPHPADSNSDWSISSAEYDAYRVAWRADTDWATAPTAIPVDYVTRAGYLVENGGSYHNDAAAKPVCWKPGL